MMLLALPSRTVTPPATLTANLASLGTTIPTNFVGFSMEVIDLISGYFQGTTGSAASMIGVLSLIGSTGNIRFGGTDSELPTPPALTQQIANNMASFVGALGSWTTVYSLNLVSGDSATAVAQANYLTNALGSGIVLQMGNEPFGSGNFTTGTYPTAWNNYYSAIIASLPGAKFAAFDDAFTNNVQTVIPALTPGKAGLQYISHHWYGYYSGTPTAEQLANSIWEIGLPISGGYGLAQNMAWAGSTKFRLTESNSRASHGLVGVSDTLMASAFYLNEAIALASVGYIGTDMNAVYYDNATYNPIKQLPNTNFAPRPLFYGMLLFSKLHGQQIAALTNTGNVNIRAIATKGTNGNANILAVNNSASQTISVKPAQSSAWSTATVLLVESGGAGPSDTTAKIGGQSIGESGTWTGAPFTISNGASVSIPPCGAALIQIQP